MKTALFFVFALTLAACHAKKPGATPAKAPDTPAPDVPACVSTNGFIDADGDGYGAATTYCAGAPPANLVTSVLGPDCDDTQPLAWIACATCKDADGDGVYGVCDKTPATGVDADDNNPRVSTPGALATCADLDGDGYFAGCDFYPGSTADCDDARDWIHPGAANLPTGDLSEDVDCDPATGFTVNDSNAIFVDAANGNDVSGDGSAAKPFQTLGQANNVADTRTIVATVGAYSEPLSLLHPLVGSFTHSAGQWTRNGFSPDAAPTAAQWTLVDYKIVLYDNVSLVAGVAVDYKASTGHCYGIVQDIGAVTLVENNVAVDCAVASDNASEFQVGIYLGGGGHLIRQTVLSSNTNAIQSSSALILGDAADSHESHYSVIGTPQYGLGIDAEVGGDVASTDDEISVMLSSGSDAFAVVGGASFISLRGDSIVASGATRSDGLRAIFELLASDLTRHMGFGVVQSAVQVSGAESEAIDVGSDNSVAGLPTTWPYVQIRVSDSLIQADSGWSCAVTSALGDHGDVAFVNSILDQMGSGPTLELVASTTPALLINDIVLGPRFLASQAQTKFSLDNNLFFGGGTGVINGSTAADLNDCSTFSDFCAHTANNVFGDPLFVHQDATSLPAFADFHLGTSGPARGAGIDPSSLLTLTPSETLNFDKHPRVAGVWNIGPD